VVLNGRLFKELADKSRIRRFGVNERKGTALMFGAVEDEEFMRYSELDDRLSSVKYG
jgi:hypothetical protein